MFCGISERNPVALLHGYSVGWKINLIVDNNAFLSKMLLQNIIQYTAIGDGSALSFFRINQNGQIFVQQSLLSENQNTYLVSMKEI